MNATAQLVNLAFLMNLTPVQAVALPAVIKVAAVKVGATEQEVTDRMERDGMLRDYLKTACVEAAPKALFFGEDPLPSVTAFTAKRALGVE